MTRNRKSAKAAGARFERLIADALAQALDDDRIDRRPRNGAKDRGDIGGVRTRGHRVVVECKDYGGRFNIGPWLAEVDIERGSDDAGIGLVIAKRRAKGNPLDQLVLTTVRDLIVLLGGERSEK
ncbi:hypothetical protein ABQE69_17390 [Mycolicibacillus trivialis]